MQRSERTKQAYLRFYSLVGGSCPACGAKWELEEEGESKTLVVVHTDACDYMRWRDEPASL